MLISACYLLSNFPVTNQSFKIERETSLSNLMKPISVQNMATYFIKQGLKREHCTE